MHFGYVAIIITVITSGFSRLSATVLSETKVASAEQHSPSPSHEVPNSHEVFNSQDATKAHLSPEQMHEGHGPPSTSEAHRRQEHLQPLSPEQQDSAASSVHREREPRGLSPDQNGDNIDIGKLDGDDVHRNFLKKHETYDSAASDLKGAGLHAESVTVDLFVVPEPAEPDSQLVEDVERLVETSFVEVVNGESREGQFQQSSTISGQGEPSITAASHALPDVSAYTPQKTEGVESGRPQFQPDVVTADVVSESKEEAQVEGFQVPEVVIVPPVADSALKQPDQGQQQLDLEQQQHHDEQAEHQAPSQLHTPPATEVSPSAPDTGQSASPSAKLPGRTVDAGGLPAGAGGVAAGDAVDFEEDRVADVEEFQTFGEWRKKVMEEELEKENEKIKHAKESSNGESHHNTAPLNSAKLRINYASDKCGAKVISSNQEMENGKYMLTASKDEYMINPCSTKKWFIVELCEPISVKLVEVASLELFSSRPKSFHLSVSDRSPAREWMDAGLYHMTAEKVPQTFSLATTTPFVKFLKVEMLEHYGSEHFCPITFFRVFGVPMEDEEGEEEEGSPTQTLSDDENVDSESHSLFARTKETVVKLVKKMLHTDQPQDEDHVSVRSRPVNGSDGVPNMPCDPDIDPNTVVIQRPAARPVEGVTATVHLPQPTILEETAASEVPKEIPMVTKLEDSEQVEIEGRSRRSHGTREELVTLLESGVVARGWHLGALRLCSLRTEALFNTCCYNPSCLYAETLLGSSAPLCPKRISQADVVTSSPVSTSTSADCHLEPSFTSTASHAPALQSTLPVVGGEETDWSVVELSTEQTAKLFPSAIHIPEQHSTASIHESSAVKEANAAKDPQNAEVSIQTAQQPTSDKSSATVSVSEDVFINAGGGGGARMLETDPGAAAATTVEARVEELSSLQGDATQNESAETASEKLPRDLDTEILQPSAQLDTPSVVSPTLTRPTPVLEVSGASVDVEGGKGEVPETIMPSLSPSPTSEMPDAAEELPESDAYPQIIMPTIEEAQTLEQTEAPELTVSDDMPASVEAMLESQRHGEGTHLVQQHGEGTHLVQQQNTSADADGKNETKRKGLEELVHVPLTPSAKRESAIMRLTNRLKALELNVSLSSRFLEELSSRFKKQNEEMMKMLNKTMNRLNATAMASQKQASQQELRIDQLETRLDNLTATVQKLADRFDTFSEQMYDRQMTFTTVNLLLLLFCVLLMVRASHNKPLHPDVQFLLDTMPRRPQPASAFLRRNSETALPSQIQPGLRKTGSVSDIASTATPEFLLERLSMVPKKKRRKKHKAGRTESTGATDSDPGCKLSSHSSGSSMLASSSNLPKLGHRRSGSASGNFCTTPATVPQTVPKGKEVMFSIGDRILQAPVDKQDRTDPNQSLSLPYMIKEHCRTAFSCPINGHSPSDREPASARSQKVKYPTAPSSPVGLENGPFDSGGAPTGASLHGVQRTGSGQWLAHVQSCWGADEDSDRFSSSSVEDRSERSSTPSGLPRTATVPSLPHRHCRRSGGQSCHAPLHNKSSSWFSFWPKSKQPTSAPPSVVNGKMDSKPPRPDYLQHKGPVPAGAQHSRPAGSGKGKGNKRSLNNQWVSA